jgi:hypothetical protein
VSQTGIIIAAIVIAFVVFVTTRGELPQYLQVIGLEGGGSAATAATSGILGSLGGILGF